MQESIGWLYASIFFVALEPSAEFPKSCIRLCTDPWWVVGFHFVVGLNNILALGYPYLILVPLGWYAGTGLWIVGMVFAYYCNTLLASLHEYGGVRHIRHRDLAHHIYGELPTT